MEEYISLSECKHGHVYKIISRNLSHGVFNSKDNGFIGIRTKFGSRFLFTEYHWDTGPPYGTAKPDEEIGVLPSDILVGEILEDTNPKPMVYLTNKVLFEYLDKIRQEEECRE